MRTLYIIPELARQLPERCCVVVVPPLLRELILHTIANGPLRRDAAEHRRLAAFLRDQLRALPAAPLELPMPRDVRAQEVAVRLRMSRRTTRPSMRSRVAPERADERSSGSFREKQVCRSVAGGNRRVYCMR